MCASCPWSRALDAWWIIVLGMLGMPVISFSFSFLDFLPPRPDHWPVLIFNFYFRLRGWPVSGKGDVTIIIILIIITIIILLLMPVWPQLARVQGGQTSVRGQPPWSVTHRMTPVTSVSWYWHLSQNARWPTLSREAARRRSRSCSSPWRASSSTPGS